MKKILLMFLVMVLILSVVSVNTMVNDKNMPISGMVFLNGTQEIDLPDQEGDILRVGYYTVEITEPGRHTIELISSEGDTARITSADFGENSGYKIIAGKYNTGSLNYLPGKYVYKITKPDDYPIKIKTSFTPLSVTSTADHSKIENAYVLTDSSKPVTGICMMQPVNKSDIKYGKYSYYKVPTEGKATFTFDAVQTHNHENILIYFRDSTSEKAKYVFRGSRTATEYSQFFGEADKSTGVRSTTPEKVSFEYEGDLYMSVNTNTAGASVLPQNHFTINWSKTQGGEPPKPTEPPTTEKPQPTKEPATPTPKPTNNYDEAKYRALLIGSTYNPQSKDSLKGAGIVAELESVLKEKKQFNEVLTNTKVITYSDFLDSFSKIFEENKNDDVSLIYLSAAVQKKDDKNTFSFRSWDVSVDDFASALELIDGKIILVLDNYFIGENFEKVDKELVEAFSKVKQADRFEIISSTDEISEKTFNSMRFGGDITKFEYYFRDGIFFADGDDDNKTTFTEMKNHIESTSGNDNVLVKISQKSENSVLFKTGQSDEIEVRINGKKVEFDQPPIIEEGRTLVPVRAILEELGLELEYSNGVVSAKNSEFDIKLTIGSREAKVNGKTVWLDVPAKIVNDRTLVPVRFIAESINAKVDWDNSTRTVIIEK